MKRFILALKLVLIVGITNAQEGVLDANELVFKDGYDALMSGQSLKALNIFEEQIFEHKNLDAVPYYKTAACAVTEKEDPTLKKLTRAAQMAKRADKPWGSLLSKKDFNAAQETMERKASNGNAVAQYSLGVTYYYGLVTKKNPGLAFKYLKMAADQGLYCAKFGLGTCYAEGKGVEKDLDKAVELIEAAIEVNPRKNQKNYLKKLKRKMD